MSTHRERIELIAELEESLEVCAENDEKPDVASWVNRTGVVISANEGRLCIEALRDLDDRLGDDD